MTETRYIIWLQNFIWKVICQSLTLDTSLMTESSENYFGLVVMKHQYPHRSSKIFETCFAAKTCENCFRWIKFIKMTMCIIHEPVYGLWPMIGAFMCVFKSANICQIRFSFRWRNVIDQDVFFMPILQLRLTFVSWNRDSKLYRPISVLKSWKQHTCTAILCIFRLNYTVRIVIEFTGF